MTDKPLIDRLQALDRLRQQLKEARCPVCKRLIKDEIAALKARHV